MTVDTEIERVQLFSLSAPAGRAPLTTKYYSGYGIGSGSMVFAVCG